MLTHTLSGVTMANRHRLHVLTVCIVTTCLSGCQASVSNTDLSAFMTYIWNNDVNAATEVRVSLQGHTSTGSTQDRASHHLFSYFNEGYHLTRPTYAALLNLLDNYNNVVGRAEDDTYNEGLEIDKFLSEISKTAVMQKTLEFLHQKGYVSSSSWHSLETQLREIWFGGYPRHGHVYDSSGFEHVFVGELDSAKSDVVGFHNWIQFYLQEKSGRLDYMGYVFSKQPNVLGTHFEWWSRTKNLGSFVYGTSPEFDLAMYTVCFLTRRNQRCNFSINNHNMAIQTYDISHGGGGRLGTAYVN